MASWSIFLQVNGFEGVLTQDYKYCWDISSLELEKWYKPFISRSLIYFGDSKIPFCDSFNKSFNWVKNVSLIFDNSFMIERNSKNKCKMFH